MTVATTKPSAAPPLENPWCTDWARIQEIRPEVPGVATYRLQLEDEERVAAYRFLPGQFNMLYLPGFGESAISISSDPGRLETLSHTVRVAGNVTRAMANLAVGDQVGIRGPFGSPWPLERCRQADVVIACGGVGLAPLRPAIYEIINRRDQFGRVILLYGGANSQRSTVYRRVRRVA